MKNLLILDAISNINNEYILSAQFKLGYCDERHSAKYNQVYLRGTFRKALAFIAAAAIFITLCFSTAMAVSADFREMVFNFFHIKQEVTIPENPIDTELTADNMFAEPTIYIGNVIQGKYVHAPIASRAIAGVFLVCTDEIESKQGSHYDAYYEANGELIKLEEHHFRKQYTLLGNSFDLEFDWTEHNGNVILTWVKENDNFTMPRNAGSADNVLFKLCFIGVNSSGEYTESWYPVLLNLHTGELSDILSGTGAEHLIGFNNAAISDDRTKMLLQQNTESGSQLYFVDLNSKQLYSLDELSGDHVDSCSLIGSKIACWKLSDGCYKAWNIELSTLKRTDLFDSAFNAAATPEADAGIVFIAGFDSWIREGNMYAGSRFALETDENRNVYVIDLSNGARAPIDGYIWTPEAMMIPSPDGTKLLLADGYFSENKYEYIGILDFENMTLAEFSRNNTNSAREYLISWHDRNTVCISSYMDSDSYDCYLSRDFYLYSLVDDAE